MKPTSRPSILAIAMVSALAATAAAPAQFGEAAGFGEVMSPYFFKRDLVHFANGLELDEGQSVILESLYWDYEEEHAAGKAAMLDRLSNMRDELKDLERDQILGLVFQPFEERAREWQRLRDDFLQNVRAILNTEQNAEWPEFRRFLRREKELPGGRFSGESVNLYHVLRSLDLEVPVRTTADEALAAYDVYLDEVLARREDLLQQSRLMMMHSIRDQRPDDALSLYEKQIDARVAIRDINDEYVDFIAASLPADIGATFRTEALSTGYPRIFRPTYAQRLFNEALKLDDLGEEVMTAIRELESAFQSELAVVNDQLWRLIREHEPAEERYRAVKFALRSAPNPESRLEARKPADPTRDPFRRREEIGRRYIEMLQNLLTPEQFAALPGAARFLRLQNRGASSNSSELGSSGTPPTSGRPQKKSKGAPQRGPGTSGSGGKGR
jgi:hypothetical protein